MDETRTIDQKFLFNELELSFWVPPEMCRISIQSNNCIERYRVYGRRTCRQTGRHFRENRFFWLWGSQNVKIWSKLRFSLPLEAEFRSVEGVGGGASARYKGVIFYLYKEENVIKRYFIWGPYCILRDFLKIIEKIHWQLKTDFVASAILYFFAIQAMFGCSNKILYLVKFGWLNFQ